MIERAFQSVAIYIAILTIHLHDPILLYQRGGPNYRYIAMTGRREKYKVGINVKVVAWQIVTGVGGACVSGKCSPHIF